MPDRPLLVFPQPSLAQKRKVFGGPGKNRMPSAQRQTQRIEPQVLAIEQYFDQRRVEIRTTIAGAEPEDVVVLETVGTV